jgi:hypothetical protein
MPTNDFLAFAIAPGANVATQADWLADPVVQGGFVAGLLYSAKTNKAFRQSSFVASAVADLICRNTGNDALDNGDFGTFVGELENAIRALGGGTGGPSGGIPEAPIDGGTYGRQNELWIGVVPLAGNVVMTGPLQLSGDPTFANEAATKNYVDAWAFHEAPVDAFLYGRSGTNQNWARALPLAGGTLTGPLLLAADPAAALGAATKQYADTKLALAGGTMTGPLTVPKLTVQGSGAVSSFAELDLANPAAPITAGGLWRAAVGTAGNFNLYMNTAAAGDFSTTLQAMYLTPDGHTNMGSTNWGIPTRVAYLDAVAGNAHFNGWIEAGSTTVAPSNSSIMTLSNTPASDCYLGYIGARSWLVGPQASGAGQYIIYDATAGAARLIIGADGHLAVGGFFNLSTTGQLMVASNATPSFALNNNGLFWGMGNASNNLGWGPTTTAGQVSSFVMYIDGSGNLNISGATATKPGGGSWTAPSDARLKETVEPYRAGLRELTRLEPIAYRYNGAGGTARDGRTYYGLDAELTREIMPELVGAGRWQPIADPSRSDDEEADEPMDYLTVDPSALVFALVNAVKELAGQVAALKAAGVASSTGGREANGASPHAA